MANCLKTKEKEERRQRLYSTILKHPGKKFSVDDIMSMLSVGHNCAYRDIDAICEKDPNLVRTRGSVMYVMPAGSNDIFFSKVERKDMDKYPVTKNNEGYSDPTASAILKKEEKEEKMAERKHYPSNFKIGDIWSVKVSSSDKCESVLVLGVNPSEETITCCKYDTRLPRYYLKIYTKPIKYFTFRVGGLPISSLTDIKSKLCGYFDIEPNVVEKEIPVEVEKIVEKEIPVEVEKVVEKEVPVYVDKGFTQEEVDLLLAQQRAEIYEECFKMVAKMKA